MIKIFKLHSGPVNTTQDFSWSRNVTVSTNK